MKILISLANRVTDASPMSGVAFPSKQQPYRNAYEYKPSPNPRNLAIQVEQAREERDKNIEKPKVIKLKRDGRPDYDDVNAVESETPETSESSEFANKGIEFAHSDGELQEPPSSQEMDIANQSIRARQQLKKPKVRRPKIPEKETHNGTMAGTNESNLK